MHDACATVEPSRRVDVQNKADNRYMMQLRECLRREAKGLVKSGRDIFVTRNAETDRKGKFWTSHWATSHD